MSTSISTLNGFPIDSHPQNTVGHGLLLPVKISLINQRFRLFITLSNLLLLTNQKTY